MSEASESLNAADFRGLRDLLHQWAGIYLPDNKRHLLLNRLESRLRTLGIDRYSDYLEVLRRHGGGSAEAQVFINSLTTNKTSFFREPQHFEFVRGPLVRALRERATAGGSRRVQAWSAASSTGEEPYTLAMVLREALPTSEGWDIRVLATDLDTEVLSFAKAGVYEESRLAEVPAHLRKRYFRREPSRPGHHRIDPEIAGLVTFCQANLVGEPFPVRGRFDVIFCRNVMIYFDRPTQIRLVTALCGQLAPWGRLVVGHSESLIGFPLPLVVNQGGVYHLAPGAALPAAAVRAPSPITRRPATVPVERRRGVPAGSLRLPRERIVLGQWSARQEPGLIGTLLGSCVSACLYDPVTKIGGLNHFMLPRGSDEPDRPAHFGVHAMELLINGLMRLGADRSRLVAKVFGAAAVTTALSRKVSESNAAFVRAFLAKEAIPILVDRLGGTRPHDILMRTDTGDVYHRVLKAEPPATLGRIEAEAWRKGDAALDAPPPGEPELF